MVSPTSLIGDQSSVFRFYIGLFSVGETTKIKINMDINKMTVVEFSQFLNQKKTTKVNRIQKKFPKKSLLFNKFLSLSLILIFLFSAFILSQEFFLLILFFFFLKIHWKIFNSQLENKAKIRAEIQKAKNLSDSGLKKILNLKQYKKQLDNF